MLKIIYNCSAVRGYGFFPTYDESCKRTEKILELIELL